MRYEITKARAEMGASLATTLLLLTLAATSAAGIMRTALSDMQLGAIVSAADRSFWAAEQGIATGLALAGVRAAELPVAAPILVTLPASLSTGSSAASAVIVATGSDTHCPATMPPGSLRHHFEIIATAQSHHAISTHKQGFFVCMTACNGLGCIDAHSGLSKTYWHRLVGEQ